MWSSGRNILQSWRGTLVGTLLGLIAGYVLWGSRPETDGFEQDHVSRGGVAGSVAGGNVRDSISGDKLTAIPQRASGQIAELRDILTSRSSSIASKARYYELLMNLTPETAPELWKLFSQLKGDSSLNILGERREFWRRWAEIDGASACATIFETNRSFGGSHQAKRAMAIPAWEVRESIRVWSVKQPGAARSWLLTQQDLPIRDLLTEGFLDGMGRHNPEEAQRFLEEEELSDDLKRHGYLRIAWGYLDGGGVDQADQWFRSIDEDHPMKARIGRTTAGLIVDGDIGEAVGWMNRLEDPDLEKYTRGQLVEDRAADLFSYLADTEDLSALSDAPGLVRQATVKWLGTAERDTVEGWMEKQVDNPNYDLLAEPFVRSTVWLSPMSAGKWVETIHDPELRSTIEAELEKSLER